jgi:rubrerythrin
MSKTGFQPMSRAVKWREGIDPDDALWVCVSCGAELNSDCVGDECPVCHTPVEDMEEDK